jgi:hypothetical protein
LWVFETTDVAQVTKRLKDELVLAVDDLKWGQPPRHPAQFSKASARHSVMIAGQVPSKKGAVFVAIILSQLDELLPGLRSRARGSRRALIAD